MVAFLWTFLTWILLLRFSSPSPMSRFRPRFLMFCILFESMLPKVTKKLIIWLFLPSIFTFWHAEMMNVKGRGALLIKKNPNFFDVYTRWKYFSSKSKLKGRGALLIKRYPNFLDVYTRWKYFRVERLIKRTRSAFNYKNIPTFRMFLPAGSKDAFDTWGRSAFLIYSIFQLFRMFRPAGIDERPKRWLKKGRRRAAILISNIFQLFLSHNPFSFLEESQKKSDKIFEQARIIAGIQHIIEVSCNTFNILFKYHFRPVLSIRYPCFFRK